jgi:hypothetical protein
MRRRAEKYERSEERDISFLRVIVDIKKKATDEMSLSFSSS